MMQWGLKVDKNISLMVFVISHSNRSKPYVRTSDFRAAVIVLLCAKWDHLNKLRTTVCRLDVEAHSLLENSTRVEDYLKHLVRALASFIFMYEVSSHIHPVVMILTIRSTLQYILWYLCWYSRHPNPI